MIEIDDTTLPDRDLSWQEAVSELIEFHRECLAREGELPPEEIFNALYTSTKNLVTVLQIGLIFDNQELPESMHQELQARLHRWVGEVHLHTGVLLGWLIKANRIRLVSNSEGLIDHRVQG